PAGGGGITGHGRTTNKNAVVGARLGNPFTTRAPAGIVFWKVPGVGLVTSTVIVQEPLTGMVPPVKNIDEGEGGILLNESVPPQVFVLVPPRSIVKPAGRVSVKSAIVPPGTPFKVSVSVES